MTTFGIRVPKETAWSPQAATALVRSIFEDKRANNGFVRFGIFGSNQGIEFLIQLNDGVDASYLQALVRAFYPEAEIYTADHRVEITYPFYRQSIIFERKTELYYQRTSTADQITSSDPLVLVTQSVNQLLPDERFFYKFSLYFDHEMDKKEIKQALTQTWSEAGKQTHIDTQGDGLIEAFAAGIVGGIFDSYKRTARFTPSEEKLYRAKLTQRLYRMYGSVRFDTPDPARLQLFTAAFSLVKTFVPTQEHVINSELIQNSDQWDASLPDTKFWSLFDQFQAEKNNKKNLEKWKVLNSKVFYLIPEEIAFFWHLPHTGFQGQNISWVKGGQTRIPPELTGRLTGTFLGNNQYNGQVEEVRITDQERLTHVHIIGKTGTGKSTLLHQLIHQDIAMGKGVAVIDPHGQLVHDLLQTSIPNHRVHDVVILDLADEAYPPPLNLLALPKGTSQNNAAGRLMSILEKHGSFDDTVTVAPTLRAALVTLWQETTPTIRDVVRIFHNDAYRQRLLANVENPVVEDFWTMYDQKKGGLKEQLSSPIVTRMSDLYGNPYLYPVMCHPDTLDFERLIAERKIILISLDVDKGKIPDRDRDLLGSVILFQIQAAIMNGAAAHHPYYLYIDEVHQFVTSPLEQMLEDVRKKNLSITMAHQYLKQLEGERLEAIKGVVGTMLIFQCGIDDARVLAPYLKPQITADNLIDLDLYTAAISMRSGRQSLPAFTLSTLPRPTVENKDDAVRREQWLRSLSCQRYTPKTREDVMTWLRDRYRPTTTPQPNEPSDYDRK